MSSETRRMLFVAVWLAAIMLLGAFAGASAEARDFSTGAFAGALEERAGDPTCSSAMSGTAAGEELHHAALVIVFPESRTETFCIDFTEDEVTGVELLRRSGLSVVLSGFGGLGSGVCRIDDVGCSDPGDCFCQCRGGDCAYWSYFRMEDSQWRFQSVGPSTRRLRDGDADGWVWGSGRTPPGATDELCAAVSTPAPATATPPSDGSTGTGTGSEPGGGPADAATPVGGSVPSSDPSLPTPRGEQDATGRATTGGEETPQAVRHVGMVEEGREELESGASSAEEQGGGPPTGLIAFGVVAGLLAAGVGGLALRRRFGG